MATNAWSVSATGTNTSRTWDGFYMRVGNVNQLNFFSTSVVTVHPTSLDTHGAGLTFHGRAREAGDVRTTHYD